MMAGRNDTDIRLDDNWRLTQASTGDAPICSGKDCLIQDIRLEAVSQPGDLFYDPDWGWGLFAYLQEDDDGMTRLEISERIREKLQRRTDIQAESIKIVFLPGDDTLGILVQFSFSDNGEEQNVEVTLDRVKVEVNSVDR